MNKLKATLVIIAVTMAFQSHAAAQSLKIEGVVLDQNGAPVSGADATLADKSGTEALTIATNAEGRFAFDAGGDPVTLTIRARGFAPFSRTLRASDPDVTNLSITLTPAPLSEQMVVTAARTETRLSDTAASVVTLSRETLSTTAAMTLDDALRQVPGFSLFRRSGSRTANPTTQGVSLRGVGASGASRAVVLSDRIPINDPFGGWVYWGRVPRESVGRVEVVQGGASSLYGSDALGGVVNFIPRDTSQSALSFEASYGNEQTPDASLYAGGRKNGWGAQLAAETFHTDGYILVDEAERGSVDTRAGSERSTIDLTLDRSFEDRGRVFVRGSIFGESRENGTPLQTNRTHIRQLAVGGDWQSALAGAFSARVYGGTQTYDQDFSAIAANRNSETLTRSQRVPAQQTGFTLQWSRAAGAFQTLTAGVDWREVRGASDELVFIAGNLTSGIGVGGRERTLGVFGQDIIRITPRWFVTIGLRADRWRNYDALSTSRPLVPLPGPQTVTRFGDRTETAFSPRLSVLHKLSENVSLFVSGTRAFRAPTLNELYRSFRVGNVLTLANVDLQAERLTGTEAGANITVLNNRLNIRGVFFWADVTRPVANVTLQVTPALITRQRQNLGRTQSPGIEVEAGARITSSLSVSGGYQFVAATIASFPANKALEGLSIPQTPRHVFTFQARYSNPRVLTFGLQGRASSRQFDDDQNLLPLDPYFTLDAIVSRRLGSGFEVFGALENLTGQRYEVGKTPVTTLGPPLLARVGVRLNIGKR